MISKEKLFNIDILVLTSERVKLLKEVKSGNIFVSSTKTFNPEGLFSTEIFGQIGSRLRNEQYGYINLGIPILHPYIFKILMSLSSKYVSIVEGKKYAKFDKELGDFVLTENNEGSTGYNFFIKNVHNIKFHDNNSDQRRFRIKLIEKYAKPEYYLKHWLVIPAGLRDYQEDDKGVPSEDEINDIYRRLLSTANMVKNTNVGENLDLLDPIRLRLQKTTLEIFEYIRLLIDGKHKFIQGKFAKRSIKYGTRNVLTPIPAKIKNLKDKNKISLNDTQVGLYQYIKAITPITINKVQSLFINHILNPNSDQAYLINPSTMKTELVSIATKKRDEWITFEGMNNIMNKLAQSDLRLEPVKVDKYYLALVEDDGKNVRVIFNTEDEQDLNKNNLRPLTYYEMFYIAIYDSIKKYPCFVTRYPVGSLGGIYPSNVYVKTTTTGRTVNFKMGIINTTMIEYPVLGELFVESVSVNINKLGRLGGDYDGDSLIGFIKVRYNSKFAKKFFNDAVINEIFYSQEKKMSISNRKVIYNYGLIDIENFPRTDLIKIKDNVEYYKVPNGIQVLTIWNGKEKWVKPKMFTVHNNLTMLSVKTKSGRSIECSNDHTLVTLDDDLNYKRSPAKIGLAIPRIKKLLDYKNIHVLKYINKEGVEFKLDKELGYLYGVIIGDGWVNKTQRYNDVMLASIHPGIIDTITNIFIKYGWDGKRTTISNEHDFEGFTCHSTKSTWVYKPIANLFHGVIGYGSLNKQLPDWWVNTSDDFKWGLLSGLMDTDGCIYKAKTENVIRANFSTSSKKLAYGFMALCNSLDLSCSLTIHKRENKENFEYTLTIYTESLLKMKKKLVLNNLTKKSYLEECEEQLCNTRLFTPNVNKERLEELSKQFKINTLEHGRIREALRKIKKNKIGGYFIKDHFLEIANKIPEFFKNNKYWKKYLDIVKDDNIEWDIISKIDNLQEISTAYDLTVPPYNTFVIQNGIVAYDTVSFSVLYTDESIKEIKEYLNSPKAYLTPSGELIDSNADDNIEIVIDVLSE